MRTVSPPGNHLTEVSRGLLQAAEDLGHRVEVVATTSGAAFGNGFVVPDDVFELWHSRLGNGQAADVVVSGEPAAVEPEVKAEAPKMSAPRRQGRGVTRTAGKGA